MSTMPARSGSRRRPADRRPPPQCEPAAQPRPALVQAALAIVGVGLGAITALAITTETRAEFTAAGGAATFAGSLTGLVGTYLALVMVLLVSRMPFVERVLGHDGLLRWHRRLAPWPISLLVAHAVFITVGYAQAARWGLWHQVGVLLAHYPDVLIATLGLGLMCLAGAISIRAIRRRVRREVWWSVHLCMYLALALSFAHVLAIGPAFVGHPLTQAVWWAIWLATAGLVLGYRIGLPVVRSLRHRLQVVEVRPEGPGVVSVICSGQHLEKLAVSGGQFFCWRFLVKGMWWQSHPYSLSALPQPPHLRLTVKNSGDHSAAVARLRPGTKIVIEGPYGTFTRHFQQHRRVVLIAAGIGVTALRALLEDLPRGSQPVVILRASQPEDLVLGSEVRSLVKHAHGWYHELIGSREEVSINGRTLRQLVPDLDRRDVFVCGPEGFVTGVADLARWLGIADEAIHHEAFAL
ncbi:MAG TPA: ferredoxin reductase family protein [Streptosporangiaceae bacterium]|jgi:predicted ferric reductase